jgi:hypothetical protein
LDELIERNRAKRSPERILTTNNTGAIGNVITPNNNNSKMLRKAA